MFVLVVFAAIDLFGIVGGVGSSAGLRVAASMHQRHCPRHPRRPVVAVAGAQAGLQGRMLSNVFDAVDSSIISLKFCANIYLGTLIFDATPFPQRRFSLLTFSRCKGKFDISTLVKFPLTDLIPI